jgi:hypothetical protein
MPELDDWEGEVYYSAVYKNTEWNAKDCYFALRTWLKSRQLYPDDHFPRMSAMTKKQWGICKRICSALYPFQLVPALNYLTREGKLPEDLLSPALLKGINEYIQLYLQEG